jgi:hypothetical protein
MVITALAKSTIRNMFSVEIDFDDTTITVVDDEDSEEDVTVLLFDDVIYIRQYLDGDTDRASIISMTPKMYAELMEAYQRPEGTYLTRITSSSGKVK